MTVPLVKGWCPGALRPMQSGDGLVVRLRLTAGRLPPPLAAVIADLAERHGNGRIDLTQRGNLQLRGVSAATLPALHADLAAQDLLDADPAAEARRNLVVSPLAAETTLALARALEVALAGAGDLADLPAKFAFLLDDGTWPRPAGVGFDVGFVRRDGAWSVELPAPGGSLALARLDADVIPKIATRLAAAFLIERGAARRMADLSADPDAVSRLGAAAGLDVRPVFHPAPAMAEVIGETVANGIVLGVGIPFGQMEAGQLATLAAVAERGGGEIRLTPFRAVLLPGLRDPATARTALAAAGFITDPADPRRAVVACTGAPDCAAALQPARRDAATLAALAARLPGTGLRLHVSGCAKGCARPQATALTLIGTADGYDLVLDGTTRDRPRTTGLAPARLAETLASALASLERP